jgi:hypothetical protein
MSIQFSKIPELAGVATYSDAARLGYSVEESVERLMRLHWAERRLMHTLLAHIASTPVWEVKCAMALHQWYCAEHADGLRRRISEMRHPLPPLDRAPDDALNAFLEETLRANDVVELISGVHRVAFPALLDAYRGHLRVTNPLVDQPTVRLLRSIIPEVEDAIEWGRAANEALTEGDGSAHKHSHEWQKHLTAYLEAAGGIAGDIERTDTPMPNARASEPFVPDFNPARDERFHGQYNFNFPPHVVYNAPGIPADERNLALLCKRTLEMDVPEMMASFLTERTGRPWQFYLDYSRQLWDEARHAMMGTVAFEARGVDWTSIPLNVGFSLRLNAHATPEERQVILFAIEQSLMPGEKGKRFEYETAVESGDALSTRFHDYDWADEVLHAQIGRRALKREGISQNEAMERAREIHERTWSALDNYKDGDPQADWWADFVRRVLGKESAAGEVELGELKILAE